MSIFKSKLDSFSILVPDGKYKLDDWENYTVHKVRGGNDGTIISTSAPSFYENGFDGVPYGFQWECKTTGRQQTTKGLSLMVNAKQLGKDYFQGVTKDNFEHLLKVVLEKIPDLTLSIDDVLKYGRIYDADICSDSMELNDELYSKFIKKLVTQADLLNVRGMNPNKKHNAFYINTRDTSSTDRPYFKIYRKRLEYMESKHQRFYLPEIKGVIENIARAEVQMRNQTMFKKYSNGIIQSNNVKSVVWGDYSMILENVFDFLFKQPVKDIISRKAPSMKNPCLLNSKDRELHSELSIFLGEQRKENMTLGELIKTDALVIDRMIMLKSSSERGATETSRKRREVKKRIDNIYYTYFDIKGEQSSIDLLDLFNEHIGV